MYMTNSEPGPQNELLVMACMSPQKKRSYLQLPITVTRSHPTAGQFPMLDCLAQQPLAPVYYTQ